MAVPTEHWARWTGACALGLCPGTTQATLRAFVDRHFRRYVNAYASRTAVRIPAALYLSPADAWHRFETWLCLRATRQGKTYKQWLLAHAADAETLHLERAATLLVRDVVREHLRREVSPVFMRSLDEPAGSPDGTTAVSLHELIPDRTPAPTVDIMDVEAEADAAFGCLSRRQRVALLARELGLALSQPAVLAAAECGKSMLCVAYESALQAVAAFVRSRFPGEPRPSQADLAVRLFEVLRSRVVSWGKSENRCAAFFLDTGSTAHPHP